MTTAVANDVETVSKLPSLTRSASEGRPRWRFGLVLKRPLALPAKKRRRAKKEFNLVPWVLAVVAIVLLAGAIMGGLLWRARRHTPTTSSSSTDSVTQSGTETPASSAALEAAIAEADRLDPGWRWDQLWAKRAQVPLGENSAPIVIEAGRLLPRGTQKAPDFVDRDGEHRLNEQQISELNAWPKPRAAAVKVALTLANRPRGRYEITVAPDFIFTLLTPVSTTREIETILKVEALRRAEAGNAGWLEVFRAKINTARSIGDEPLD